MNCSVEGCEKKYYAQGHCNTHYARVYRNGTLKPKYVRDGSKTCSVEGCDKETAAHGICMKHYQAQRRNKMQRFYY